MSLRALTRPTPIYWSHDGNRICLAFLFFIEIVRFGRKRKYFVGDSFDFHATAINISIVIGSKGTMAAWKVELYSNVLSDKGSNATCNQFHKRIYNSIFQAYVSNLICRCLFSLSTAEKAWKFCIREYLWLQMNKKWPILQIQACKTFIALATGVAGFILLMLFSFYFVPEKISP